MDSIGIIEKLRDFWIFEKSTRFYYSERQKNFLVNFKLKKLHFVNIYKEIILLPKMNLKPFGKILLYSNIYLI